MYVYAIKYRRPISITMIIPWGDRDIVVMSLLQAGGERIRALPHLNLIKAWTGRTITPLQ